MKTMWQKATKDFKTRLRVSFTALIALCMIMVGIVSYQYAKNAVSSQIMGSAANSVNILDSIITTLVEPKMQNTEWFAQQAIELAKDPVEIQESFDQYLGLHPEVSSLMYATEDGRFFSSPQIDLGSDYNYKNRDWYTMAMNDKKKTIITPVYISAGNDNLVFSIAKADNKGKGVLAISINLTILQNQAKSVKIGEEGYAILIDQAEKFIYHPIYKEGEAVPDNGGIWKNLFESNSGNFSYSHLEDNQQIDKEMFFTTNKLTGWKTAGTLVDDEVSKAAAPIFRSNLIVVIIGLIVGFFITYFVIRSIVTPIRRMQQQAEKVSRGDLSQSIEITTIDEIGALGHALNEMQNNLRTLIRNVDSSSKQVASASEELKQSASQTSEASEQVSIAITEIAEGAEKQIHSLEQNSQMLHETYSGITQITERAMIVSELSARTSEEARDGGAAVDQTLEQMKSISSSVLHSNETIRSLHKRANQIDEISIAINHLAAQTNLLALNASIEAARAGEHGKGFTVVVSEVRKLAEQSASSSAHISELIHEVQRDAEYAVQMMAKVTDEVQEGLRITDGTRSKFQVILGSMEQTSPIIEDVAAILQQTSNSIEGVTEMAKELSLLANGHGATSEEVAASSQEQLASMEEITASSNSLSSMATDLQRQISRFKV